jgi:chromosome partitioning protein
MKVICVVNHKGGVGKTTSVVNIGAGLALAGAKVLLIDGDAQCNLSESVGLVRQEPNIYTALMSRKNMPIYKVKNNLDAVPASLALAKADMEMAGIIGCNSNCR